MNIFHSAKLIGGGIDPDVYHRTGDHPRGHRDFIMSRGALAGFLDCPSKWIRGADSKDTSATKWGSLMDALVLSPDSMEKRFAVYPDTYMTRPANEKVKGFMPEEKPWNNNATVCREWKSKNAGKSFIHREKFDGEGEPDEDTKSATLGNAQRAKARLMDDARLKSLVENSETQVMVMAEYRAESTKIVVPFKVLLDLVPHVEHPEWGKTLADFKTARDGSERGFTKAVHEGFYDWQAVLYRDAYVKATEEDRCDFLYAVQENQPPYEPALWQLGTSWLDDVRAEVRNALEFYCSCLAANQWPSYQISSPVASYGALSREAYMLRNIPRPIPTSTPQPQFKSETPT